VATARVIIVDTNDGAFIGDAVESALRQTVSCEVVIVDNASTDGSAERLASIPGVRVIPRASNEGFGAAVNTGAADTTTEFIALLNPDAQASPEWLTTITQWMNEQGVDVACSYVAAGDGYYFTRGRFWRWLGGATDDRTPSTDERTDFVNGCALVIRSDVFRRLGGFDEGFFLYCDDVDLSLRAIALGYRIRVCPRTLVRHDHHGSSTKALGSRKWLHVFASRGRLVAKHCRNLTLPVAFIVQAFIVPVRFAGGVRAARPLIRAVFKGYFGYRRETRAHP
jgi:GT2 family glycosyltransferase